jgi:hypothetical protein
VNEWVTLLVRTKLGHDAGTSFTGPAGQDGILEIWVAVNGTYVPIVRRYDVATSFENYPHGHQDLRLAGYYNNAVWPWAWSQDFAEIIFKKADPATPQNADPAVWGIPPPAAGL